MQSVLETEPRGKDRNHTSQRTQTEDTERDIHKQRPLERATGRCDRAWKELIKGRRGR